MYTICPGCNQRFKKQSESQKTCSLQCRGKVQRNRIEWCCLWCQKLEYKTPYDAVKRRFCSKQCSSAYQRIPENNPNYRGGPVQLKCEVCKEYYDVDHRRIEKSRYCSRKCQHKAYETQFSGENNPFFGRTHTDEAKSKIGESSSSRAIGIKSVLYGKSPSLETRKKMSDNHIDISGQNNPMWGRSHSKETKERLSQKAIERHQIGVIKSGIGKSGWYTSKVTDRRSRYDSSYELTRFEQLDKLGLDWEKHHGIVIKYWFQRQSHRYIPDIVIKYSPQYWVIEEIKPVYMLDDPRTAAKIRAGKRWADKRGYKFCIITEYDLGLRKPKQSIC